MAFSLAQASDKLYPLPWAPQIRRIYQRILRERACVLLLSWLLATVWATVLLGGWLLGVLPSWATPSVGTSWFALSIGLSPVLFVALAAGDALTAPLVRSIGYARAGAQTVSGRHAKLPPSLAGAVWALGGTGFALGLIVGAAVLTPIAAMRGARPIPSAVLAATVIALSSLTIRLVLRSGARARAGWRAEVEQQQIAARVLATGQHAVGRVTTVQFTGQWLEQQPVFRVGVAFPFRGAERTVRINLVEYPQWAPVAGNEFDVWHDGSRDPRALLLERRIVGQEFQSEVTHLRRPESGGDGPSIGPLMPRWAEKAGRPAAVALAAAWLQSMLSAAVTVFTAAMVIAWIAVIGFVVWWAVLAMALVAVLDGIVLRWWVLLLVRSPRLLETTRGIQSATWLSYTAAGLAVTGAALTGAWNETNATAAEDRVLILSGLAALASAMLNVMLGFSFDSKLTKIMLSDVSAPVDEVHQALRSSDPAQIDRLRERHGYRVGALHTQ